MATPLFGDKGSLAQNTTAKAEANNPMNANSTNLFGNSGILAPKQPGSLFGSDVSTANPFTKTDSGKPVINNDAPKGPGLFTSTT